MTGHRLRQIRFSVSTLSVAAWLLQAFLWSPFCHASEDEVLTKPSDAIHERLPAVPDTGDGPQALADAIRDAHERAQSDAGQEAMDGLRDLATLYHANDFVQEAEICYRLLGEVQPEEPRWLYLLAYLRLRSGDAEGAEKRLSCYAPPTIGSG